VVIGAFFFAPSRIAVEKAEALPSAPQSLFDPEQCPIPAKSAISGFSFPGSGFVKEVRFFAPLGAPVHDLGYGREVA
jgi:hypothetical protein